MDISIEELEQVLAGMAFLTLGVVLILFRDPLVRWNYSWSSRMWNGPEPSEDFIEFSKRFTLIGGVAFIAIGVAVGVGALHISV